MPETNNFCLLCLPDLTGFEVLREMRRNLSTQSIPVIVHTSKDLSMQEMDDLANLGTVVYPKQEFSSKGSSDRLRQVLNIAGIGN